jgi:outer membrane protein assembly factor BamE (lipoprotein component of BamABCDE complex)
MKKLLLLALLPCLTGCFVSRSGINEPLDAELVGLLEPGTTTAREVVEILGGPNEVVQLGRRSAYRYGATGTKTAIFSVVVLTLRNEDTRQDRLWVFFDENDTLTHYGATFASHRTQYAMTWEDIHEPADRDADDAERAGVGRDEGRD